jgi:hypothetical protein
MGIWKNWWKKDSDPAIAKEVIKEDVVHCSHDINGTWEYIINVADRGVGIRSFRTSRHLIQCKVCKKLYIEHNYSSYYDSNCYDYHDINSESDTTRKEYAVMMGKINSEYDKGKAHIIGMLEGIATEHNEIMEFSISDLNDYAVKFSNGKGLCFVDGLRVPDKWIFEKDELNIKDFLGERNIELRRIFTQIIGEERLKLLFGKGSIVMNEEKIGEGTLQLLKLSTDFGDVRMLKISNSWEQSSYYLYVPPWIKSAREGVAWSFYQDPTDYKLEAEA